MAEHKQSQSTSWMYSGSALILFGFLVVAVVYLLTEHTVHVFGALPWLLLALCPLMHLFMHGGHGRPGQGEKS